MCNCYSVTPPVFGKSALLRRFESLLGNSRIGKDGNALLVRPTLQAPVYTLEKGCTDMRWGLERPWAKAINNARIEKRATLWKQAWAEGRCLIPMTGWYEFSGGRGRMTCHFLEPVEEGLLLAAGLWEKHVVLGDCFTMIMAESDPATLQGKIHHRMPVLLSAEDGERWMEQEPVGLVGSPGLVVKETIVPSPLKRRQDQLVQGNLL